MTEVRGRMWVRGEPADGFTFSAISDCLTSEDTLVWADIYDPDHDTLMALADELKLNIWAVEDATAPNERTKATVYRTHTFFTVYAVQMLTAVDDSTSTLVKHRISAFVLPRGLITVRLPPLAGDDPGFAMDEVSQRFDELGGQQYGVGALVHGLLDVVVDGHFDAVQSLDDGIESLEDELFDEDGPKRGLQRRTFRYRKDLVELRRVVLPMREVVSAIKTDGWTRRPPRARPALRRPLRPRAAGIGVDRIASRHGHDGVRDEPSLQDARLNTVMKKLTGWAAIIAVPTAVTGFYGQNVSTRVSTPSGASSPALR